MKSVLLLPCCCALPAVYTSLRDTLLMPLPRSPSLKENIELKVMGRQIYLH